MMGMEKKKEEEEEEELKSNVFPLFAASGSSAAAGRTSSVTVPQQWLFNSSFTTDLSVINTAVSSLHDRQTALESDQDGDSDHQRAEEKPSSAAYDLIPENDEEEEKEVKEDYYYSDSDSGGEKLNKKKKKSSKKKHSRKRKRSRDESEGFTSRKSSVRVWADSGIKPPKDYYFDTHGDRDNLVYGSLYKMDVPRYKPYLSTKPSGLDYQGLYLLNGRVSLLDKDGDVDVLDAKMKSAGRYWSAKYAAVERHRNLKRLRLVASKQPAVLFDEFIPFSDIEMSREATDNTSMSKASMCEESWEDEVLRKTREFNKLTREHPHDEKAWLDFAEFQDKVAKEQRQKGARSQTLEKKISILEKATELNPDNEDLLIYLMKAYQSRDTTDVLIGRWEKVLIQHSGSYNLWKEYLHVVKGEFSKFKVSDMRKMYGHAIQALSAACNKQFRQVHQNEEPSFADAAITQIELGLVDIFLSLCRFEWQSGYQELATALFQAEIEFSLFCPSLLLSEHSKLRLFEHFWNSDGPRVGEEGALGWSTWLEKEEENRQRIIKEETSHDDDKGGWTGWSEPVSKHKETDVNPDNVTENVGAQELQGELEDEDISQEEDAEALLKQLGIDVDVEASGDVHDTSTWTRWSEVELSRDHSQWMPVHGKSDDKALQHEGMPDGEADIQVLRVILFEDVSEYLFSLRSEEARLSLVSQFVEFFGVEMSRWICTNGSRWKERIFGLEVLPDSILQNLRRVHDILVQSQTSSRSNSLEFLLGHIGDNSKRTDMMKFLRNAVLLCLAAFPRNYMLEEAALVAEELSITRTDSSTPSRALAKSLLKRDRQDVLLCGVYAQREAIYGNIGYARRVFDMALSSVEGLPLELQSNAPLLYFWYAQAELAAGFASTEESSSRALHILCCLGSGTKYSPFKCKPSSMQLLKAHQGFKEKMKSVRLAWVRGVIDDPSVALTCSAALFEELTSGFIVGIQVLDEAFTMVLPERRSQSYNLEFLFYFYVRMLLRYQKKSSLSKLWESILQGLQIYPTSTELFSFLVETSHNYTTPNKLRLMLDDYCQRKPSVIVWLFALSFEISKGGSEHRIHGLFERALANDRLRKSVVLWRMYIAYEVDIACNPSAGRRIFFRAIHACPWSKKLWLDGFRKLNSILSAKELSDLQEVMRDKELNLRTDVYEILLQD